MSEASKHDLGRKVGSVLLRSDLFFHYVFIRRRTTLMAAVLSEFLICTP